MSKTRKMLSVAVVLVAVMALGSVAQADVVIDSFDSGYTDWTGSNGTSAIANDTTIKTEGTASMKLRSNWTNANGTVYKTWSPKLNLLGETALQFSIYLPDGSWYSGLPGDSGFKVSLFASSGTTRRLSWRIGFDAVTVRDDWATVRLAWTYDVNGEAWATLDGSNFAGTALTAGNGSSVSNYSSLGGQMGYMSQIEFNMDSDSGYDKYWYLDDLRAIPEPATLCLLSLGGIGILVRRRRRR